MLPSDSLPPDLPSPDSLPPSHNAAFSAQFWEGHYPSGEFSTELSFWLERLVPKHLSPSKRAIVRQMVTRWVAESRLRRA